MQYPERGRVVTFKLGVSCMAGLARANKTISTNTALSSLALRVSLFTFYVRDLMHLLKRVCLLKFELLVIFTGEIAGICCIIRAVMYTSQI